MRGMNALLGDDAAWSLVASLPLSARPLPALGPVLTELIFR